MKTAALLRLAVTVPTYSRSHDTDSPSGGHRGAGAADLPCQATARTSWGRTSARVEIFSEKICPIPAARRE